MQFKSALVVTGAVFVAAMTGYGCSSKNPGTDGGPGEGGTKDVKVPLDSPINGEGGTCGPVDTSGFTPENMNKPVQILNACNATNVADYADCQTGNQAKCAQFGQGQPAATCGMCIETQKTAASWGPLVFDGQNGSFNIEGCVDLSLGQVSAEPNSCGQLLHASYGCQDAACSACTGTDFTTCDQTVIAGQCKSFDTPVESASGPCATLLGDAPPAASSNCFPDPSITDPTAQRKDFISKMVNYFCGTNQ